MGTFVSITVVHPDIKHARKAMGLAFKEIFRINNLMSLYREESEVCKLNREGIHRNTSPDTLYVIQRAVFFSALTQGAFDITLLPLLKVWENHVRKKKIPAQGELREKLACVGYENIAIKGRDIRFLKKHMGITLAGVAKGYAVDRAIEILKKNGIRHTLVNGGGDIRVLGGKSEKSPWKIGILDPKNKKICKIVKLNNQAVATSGAYRRAFNDLIDPKGAKPAQKVISATCIAPKALDADVLATASLIMGSEKGLHLVDHFEDTWALHITQDGKMITKSNKEKKHDRLSTGRQDGHHHHQPARSAGGAHIKGT